MFSTSGDTMSTWGISWVHQGYIMMHVREQGDKAFQFILKTPMYWTPLGVLMISPTCIMIFSQCTEHPWSTHDIPHMHHDIPPMYWTPLMYSWYPPDVLMISPRCTRGIPRCTEHTLMCSWYSPRCTEHPLMYLWYPPDVLMVPPDVLNTPWCTYDIPPMYSWYPPMYWTPPPPRCTEHTLYRVIKIELDVLIWRLKQLESFLKFFINSSLSISIFLIFIDLTNSKKLLRNFEYSESWDSKNYQYCSCGSRRRAQRSWPLFSFFFFLKDKDSTHTFNNKGKTAWNVNLIIYFMDTCMAIAYWTMLPPLLPDIDKAQSSVIFGSERYQWDQ